MRWRLSTERFPWTVAFLVASAAVPALISAQVVQGRFVDDATGQPVASVSVELLWSDEGVYTVATDVTDDQGHFILRAGASGTYRLRSARIGYQPVTTRVFDLVEGAQPLEVEVRISAVAVPIEPLTIVSDRADRLRNLRLETSGYFERKERYGSEGLGLGEFLEREEIQRHSPSRISDALRTVRGVRVEGAGGVNQTITLRGQGMGGRCIPPVYVDGSPAGTGRDIDALLSPYSLAAIEVYPGLSVPAEFWRDVKLVTPTGVNRLPPCGAIALWTGYAELESEPEPDTPPTDQALVAELAQLALHLTIAADFVTLGDTLQATVTISNLSNDARSLCVTDSRYTLRGTAASRDIVEQADQGPCLHDITLAPRASHSWQDVVTFMPELDQPGAVLIQKEFRLSYQPCGYREECEVQLRSAPLWLTIYPD
ncbi:MAG: carboxypeptidase regulatory-like domain-containing protein [Gemmatimonadota bacterium]|nr:MAG: carboxypeptidase regulatory-like domain-containing protein [Gemmatimonadota bacterium]